MPAHDFSMIPNGLLKDEQLSGEAKIVYALLVCGAGPGSEVCEATMRGLMQLTGFGRVRVRAALAELIASGDVVRARRQHWLDFRVVGQRALVAPEAAPTRLERGPSRNGTEARRQTGRN